jgi:hypothetical protein
MILEHRLFLVVVLLKALTYVLQERLKLAGMRWDIANAQALLHLTAKYKSGLWGCGSGKVTSV